MSSSEREVFQSIKHQCGVRVIVNRQTNVAGPMIAHPLRRSLSLSRIHTRSEVREEGGMRDGFNFNPEGRALVQM